jgi:hypothetical protein
MEYPDEEVTGRLVTAKHGDEIASDVKVLLRHKTDDCLGHFALRIGEGLVSPGFRYRLQVDGRPEIGLHVIGIDPPLEGDGVIADGSIFDLSEGA